MTKYFLSNIQQNKLSRTRGYFLISQNLKFYPIIFFYHLLLSYFLLLSSIIYYFFVNKEVFPKKTEHKNKISQKQKQIFRWISISHNIWRVFKKKNKRKASFISLMYVCNWRWKTFSTYHEHVGQRKKEILEKQKKQFM